MKLRVVCQLCGRTEILETTAPSPVYIGFISLEDVEGFPKVHPFATYEIWVCSKCETRFILDYDLEGTPEIDFKAFHEAILESLKLKDEER